MYALTAPTLLSWEWTSPSPSPSPSPAKATQRTVIGRGKVIKSVKSTESSSHRRMKLEIIKCISIWRALLTYLRLILNAAVSVAIIATNVIAIVVVILTKRKDSHTLPHLSDRRGNTHTHSYQYVHIYACKEGQQDGAVNCWRLRVSFIGACSSTSVNDCLWQRNVAKTQHRLTSRLDYFGQKKKKPSQYSLHLLECGVIGTVIPNILFQPSPTVACNKMKRRPINFALGQKLLGSYPMVIKFVRDNRKKLIN